MLVSSLFVVLFVHHYTHTELVKELTLAVQNNEHEKAVKIAHEKAVQMVEVIGKAAAQLRSFPVFFKHFINPPTTTRGRSVEDRLKAIKEATSGS